VKLSDILLSASIIVRNEERFLKSCLESIKPVVDEIVIVDTGSTDGTKEIACSLGARVYDFPWNEDFSEARNNAFDHCRGNWILYIDADEMLRPVNKSYVREILSDREKVACTVRFHPIVGYTAYREYRIFRNDPRIRFEGVIHETIVPSVHAVALEDGLQICKCDLTIDHYGYEGDQMQKQERNLPLLRRQVDKDPDRIYLRWQLGVALKGLGDLEGAEKVWMEAIEIIREKKEKGPEDSHPYYDMIRLRYEQGGELTELVSEAEALFPDNYLIIWTKAVLLMQDHKFEDAVPHFRYLASIDPEKLDAGLLAYNSKLFNELSYEPLATCYYKLRRLKESEKYYSLAVERDPENAEYRTKHQFVSALLKRDE